MKLLRKAVFDYLKDDPIFKHDNKIVIRVFANLRGLGNAYANKGILPNPTAYNEFVLGFNKAHPLCDFTDAGNHKEAADSKLKGQRSDFLLFNFLTSGRTLEFIYLKCSL